MTMEKVFLSLKRRKKIFHQNRCIRNQESSIQVEKHVVRLEVLSSCMPSKSPGEIMMGTKVVYIVKMSKIKKV
jgi:hypothetical protein